MKHLLGLQLFKYVELTNLQDKMMNFLSACLIMFELVTLMMM